MTSGNRRSTNTSACRTTPASRPCSSARRSRARRGSRSRKSRRTSPCSRRALRRQPVELLGGDRCRDVLLSLGGRRRLVVIDTAPLLPVTDAAALSRSVDAVILVSRAKTSTKRQTRSALEVLRQVGRRADRGQRAQRVARRWPRVTTTGSATEDGAGSFPAGRRRTDRRRPSTLARTSPDESDTADRSSQCARKTKVFVSRRRRCAGFASAPSAR